MIILSLSNEFLAILKWFVKNFYRIFEKEINQ